MAGNGVIRQNSPNKSLYFCLGLSIFSLWLVFSSSDGYFFWMASELGVLAYLGVLSSFPKYWAESGVKYYLPNSMGGLLFILGFLLTQWQLGGIGVDLVLCGLLLKLGVFPFHFWVGPVADKVNSLSLFMLFGPQKFIPLHGICWGLSFLPLSLIDIFAFFSVFGGLIGVTMVRFHLVLAYSSIVTGGWLVCLSFVDPLLPYLFLLGYSVTLCGLLLVSGQGGLVFSPAGITYLVLLGGFPAGPVFLAKWLSLSVLSGWSHLACVLLVISVVLTSGMYLKLILRSMFCVGRSKPLSSNFMLFLGALFSFTFFLSPVSLGCPYSSKSSVDFLSTSNYQYNLWVNYGL